MASYTEDLTCSICLTLFTDPVSLLCGHAFCRECIKVSLGAQDHCPECRTKVPTQDKYFPTTSHILKRLAERAKEAEKTNRGQGNERTEGAECLCPEHGEKLKLLCETGQQLACVICRDGEKHEGHKFKPVKEAAVFLRQELERGVENLPDDIQAIESLVDTQKEELTKIQTMSQQLVTQIGTQFEEMHEFLRKREAEIKSELQEKEKEAVEEMNERLNAMEMALSERRELEEKVITALEISDSVKFLQSWTELSNMMTPEDLFSLRSDDLQVAPASLSLGPYESHLQFFVWKEMLQVIRPRPDLIYLKRDNTDLTVSQDRRTLLCIPKSSQSGSSDEDGQPNSHNQINHTFSTQRFSARGRHYWEIEVGERNYWELGVKDNFLKYESRKYSICNNSKVTKLTFTGRPQKIGLYLNCPSKELSFYNADNMKLVHTMRSSLMLMPVAAYFNIGYSEDKYPNPLTVCWYGW